MRAIARFEEATGNRAMMGETHPVKHERIQLEWEAALDNLKCVIRETIAGSINDAVNMPGVEVGG